MVRPVFRSSFAIFTLVYAFSACSSKDNDFFGATAGASGTSGAGGSQALSGAGGSGSPVAGTGGSGTSGDGSGGSGLSSGGAGTGGGSGAGGAPGVGGSTTGGAPPISGSGGTGEMGGEGGDAAGGMGSGGTPDEPGGAAGDGTSSGGSATGGSSGTAGTTGGDSGSAGTTAGSGGSTSGSGGGPPGGNCHDDGDCDSNEFCEKEACDAEEGVCKPQPGSCVGDNAVFDPVCGCDGMTYFTPCVAAREGVNVLTAGECTGNNRPTCTREDGGESCEPYRAGARCYRPRVGCEGSSAVMGVCWVLPDECPANEEKVNTYCGGGGEARCVGLCEVLWDDLAVWRDSNGCP